MFVGTGSNVPAGEAFATGPAELAGCSVLVAKVVARCQNGHVATDCRATLGAVRSRKRWSMGLGGVLLYSL